MNLRSGLVLLLGLIMASGCAAGPAARPAPVKSDIHERGLVAQLYTPPGAARRPAIILLGGSEGGIDEDDAKALAAHGYLVLSLAYFGAPGLPDEMGDIPLEYFDTAIDWLKAQRGADPAHIGMVGVSKGAEAALLVASRNPAITAVVAGSPSSVAWQGIGRASREGRGSWSLAGKSAPFLAYDNSAPFTTVGDLYTRSWAKHDAFPNAAIAVERINAPILLVCGEKDKLWPSCPMAEAIDHRRDAAAVRPSVRLLRYANAGHGFLGPPWRPTDPDERMDFGGKAGLNADAAADSWPKVLRFLDSALGL